MTFPFQLMAHLVGDYLAQAHWMATEKTSRNWAAFAHVASYGLSFAVFWAAFNLMTGQDYWNVSWPAMGVITITHYFIDRYRLARYIIFAKNRIGAPELTWEDCKNTGFPSSTPPWLAVWLLIICDNIIHILINGAAIWYFTR